MARNLRNMKQTVMSFIHENAFVSSGKYQAFYSDLNVSVTEGTNHARNGDTCVENHQQQSF